MSAAAMYDDSILLSGTVYFGPAGNADAVIEQWIENCRKWPITLPDGREAWDQRCLQIAIGQIGRAKFKQLPMEYCYAVGCVQERYPDLNATILHLHGHLGCCNELVNA